ncbi:amidase [Modestobacter sp. VKM Ac-2978]|uniref:amidase n=1 Tax=Modestobacter sp. VKM Ac-2978 TaxID=3004132 RepID=UPI0022AAED81|nr:amidase [Modestobacter sp. VKM Ac-2978]MCZ2850611.1 amidase [Modestobacter sp. VKM Ac-2978]
MDASAGSRPSGAPAAAGSGEPTLDGVVGLPATELAARVRAGELSAVDVVRAHLRHLAAVEARIGAFRVVRTEAALAEAAAVDARPDRARLPLAGVPIAVKDNVAVAGEVATDGSSAHLPAPASADHPVVARLRAAGAVVVGITRVPELCLYCATDGPGTVTRNPWDTARSAAGSSGGSAAAVSAGVVPLAQGNDGMGSLRLPAAACGLVTLKPGSGVVPALIGADSWSGMAENGVLATTVADLAVGFAVLAGTEPAPPAAPVGPLRIAVSTRSPVPGVRLDAAGRAALDAVVAELRAAGHVVVEKEPLITPAAAVGTITRWLAGADSDAEALGLDRQALEPRSRTHARLGRWVRRAGLVRPKTAAAFRARMADFFSDVDVLLSPVVSGPPLAARPWHERGFLANITANARWAPWTSAWNVAGLPALVLPAGPGREGLPSSVQFVGPAGAETRLLWLAGELEGRLPWRRHAPVFDPAGPVGGPAG